MPTIPPHCPMPTVSLRSPLPTLSLRSLVLRSLVVVACGVAASPSVAESLTTSASSAASSASSAGSASLRGSSDSISGSSDSSRDDRPAVANGDYRVAAVAEVRGRPGFLRLTMEPLVTTAEARGFQLDLPARALGERRLVPGDVISAQQRPYGLEFARGRQREAFFLVLADDWHRDLETRPLVR